MDDIIKLESPAQDIASEDLNIIIDFARAGHRKSQNYLKKLWPECNWKTIKERLEAEGSIWYVFYMDGINQHLQNLKGD